MNLMFYDFNGSSLQSQGGGGGSRFDLKNNTGTNFYQSNSNGIGGGGKS
jgi:hypothetical protein